MSSKMLSPLFLHRDGGLCYDTYVWYDVITVGGGPAGATAAYELARSGFQVLLLEKKRLPRHKACGGCLSPRILSALSFDVREAVEETIHHATFTFNGADPCLTSSARPMGYMVERSRFDHLLCQMAVKAGARLQEGQVVKDVRRASEGVEVATENGTYRARLVIGADGANSIVRRRLFPGPHEAKLAALEGRVILKLDAFEAVRGRIFTDIGLVPRGYAWAFPKMDHVNVGVMAPRPQAKRLKGLLLCFLESHQAFAGSRLGLLRGALVPAYDGSPHRIAGEKAILVGDAAFLVDPLLGEGIYYAVKSAKIASRWAIKALMEGEEALQGYEARIAEEMDREFRMAIQLSRLIYRLPWLSYRALKRHPGVVEAYADLLRGEETYEGLARLVRRKGLATLGLGWLVRQVRRVEVGKDPS